MNEDLLLVACKSYVALRTESALVSPSMWMTMVDRCITQIRWAVVDQDMVATAHEILTELTTLKTKLYPTADGKQSALDVAVWADSVALFLRDFLKQAGEST